MEETQPSDRSPELHGVRAFDPGGIIHPLPDVIVDPLRARQLRVDINGLRHDAAELRITGDLDRHVRPLNLRERRHARQPPEIPLVGEAKLVGQTGRDLAGQSTDNVARLHRYFGERGRHALGIALQQTANVQLRWRS